jgi:hypothetical protein
MFKFNPSFIHGYPLIGMSNVWPVTRDGGSARAWPRILVP